MKFKLYRNFGALNSVPVFNAFAAGVQSRGHQIVEDSEDVAVIWSVLWNGRMAGNQQVYNHCVANRRPIIIIEVGSLLRGITWRISDQHVNAFGIFGNDHGLDHTRPGKLGIVLKPVNLKRKSEILVAGQHHKSLQWQGQLSMDQWVRDTIFQIKHHTDRKIVVRPHPRSPLRGKFTNATIEHPRLVANTYDNFDINYNYHCVINHNSGPAVQAAVAGTPVICDSSSLAFPVAEKWENLQNPVLPDRTEWFVKLSHTEWTVDEIAQGTPLSRLENHLEEKLQISP